MPPIYLQGTSRDQSYLGTLKGIKPASQDIRVNMESVSMLTEVIMRAAQYGTKQIATTSPQVLKLLLEKDKFSQDDYAGSIIEARGCEWLILNPLEHLVSVPYGKYLFQRYLSKFWDSAKWLQVPEFTWNIFAPEHMEHYLQLMESEQTIFASVDIETLRNDPDRVMTCCGFTIVQLIGTELKLTTVTIPLFPDSETNPDVEFNLLFLRAMCATSTPKVLQNGKYDIAYLLRFNCPLRGYSGDTKTLFNSWYSELPKRLDFLASFCLRKWEYWKSENVGIGVQHYKYNAKDCFATACIWISMLLEVPEYALSNFKHKFPLLYPSILAEHTGFKIDTAQKEIVAAHVRKTQEDARVRLATLVGCKSYNPGSWQQTLKLWNILGCSDITSTDAQNAAKVADRHPLNEIIVDQIKTYREAAKAAGSYADKEFVWCNRLYYSLNPDATETGRNASQESAFWCGMNIQNWPVAEGGPAEIKSMVVPDPGFELMECDYAQNETWYTAYVSGDAALVAAIEDRSRDFHAHNAEKFFGKPYSSVVRTTLNADGSFTHKTIDKPLRNLAKRPNHGANYNMTAGVMLDTMGLKKVREAQKLLGLPGRLTPKQVCQELLNMFDRTYPVVRGEAYERIKTLVESSGILVGPTGWTRRCFGNPRRDKRAMNMYAAHQSQSPAAIMLDKAYLRVFKEVWLPLGNQYYKMGPQIHDSIFGQYKEGHPEIALKVQSCMDNSLDIKDIFGKVRTLRVPTDLKTGGLNWAEM